MVNTALMRDRLADISLSSTNVRFTLKSRHSLNWWADEAGDITEAELRLSVHGPTS